MKRIPLHGKRGQGKFALIDDQDYALVASHSWYVNEKGYCRAAYSKGRRSDGKRNQTHLSMHRLVMHAERGQVIDHKNRNPLDNRHRNLRFCSLRQNNRNITSYNSQSRYKGVRARGGKWSARIKVNYSEVYLGTFNTEQEAALAYNIAAKKYFGRFAGLNEVRA